MKTKTQGLALRKRKILKIIGASGLAFFMGIGTLCGVLLAPMNSAHATTSGATSVSNATNLAGTLELDPENDPVVYTTDYGLDIRWHMKGLPNNPNDISIMPDEQKFETYAYFSHANVNWVIIGCSNKALSLSGVLNLSNILEYYYHKAGYYNFSNTTSDIWHYLSNPIDHELEDQLKDIYSLYDTNVYASHSNLISQNAVFPNAQSTDELEYNEVLCFAQKSILISEYGANRNYANSTLKIDLDRYYLNNLTELPIIAQPLKTIYYGCVDSNGDDLGTSFHIFPLAGASSTEDFYYARYLIEESDYMKEDTNWWLRSGKTQHYLCTITTSGTLNTGDVYNGGRYGDYGARPAFVLKI